MADSSSPLRVEVGEPAQGPQARHKAVFAAAVDDELGQLCQAPADRLLGDGELFGPIVRPGKRVYVGGCAEEGAVVDPLRLDELELLAEPRLKAEEQDAAIGPVVLQDALGQHRAVAGATPDYPVIARYADDRWVAGVRPTGVGAERALEAPSVVVRGVEKGVVPP